MPDLAIEECLFHLSRWCRCKFPLLLELVFLLFVSRDQFIKLLGRIQKSLLSRARHAGSKRPPILPPLRVRWIEFRRLKVSFANFSTVVRLDHHHLKVTLFREFLESVEDGKRSISNNLLELEAFLGELRCERFDVHIGLLLELVFQRINRRVVDVRQVLLDHFGMRDFRDDDHHGDCFRRRDKCRND